MEVEGFQAWLYALRGTVSDWTKAPYLLLLCDERAPVYALYATVDLAAVAGLWNFTMVDAEGGLAGFYDIRDQRVRGPEVRDVGDMILGEMPEGLKDAELVALDTPVWRTDRKLQSQVLDSFAAGVTAKLEEARVKAGTGHSPKLVVQPNLTDRVAHLYVMLAACRGGGATTILDRNRVPSLPKSIPQDVQSFPKKE
ncbi:MAG: hypothetical protein HYY93_05745 [Planctomycetes bacterium]|nr:hypothetical protein [Planctomycetota bacterium]